MTNDKIEFVDVALDDEGLEEKKMMLESAKLNKDDSDIQLDEMERKLDSKLPLRLLEDTIKQTEEDLKNKVFRRRGPNGDFLTDATEAEMDLMKISLESMKKMRKLDIPMRDLRFQINSLRRQKKAVDAPEQQIKKLEKEIRNKKETVPSNRIRKQPLGVG